VIVSKIVISVASGDEEALRLYAEVRKLRAEKEQVLDELDAALDKIRELAQRI
jgi:phosphomannomutase